MTDYDAVLRDIYSCVLAPQCADAGEGGWPAPPHGRSQGQVDVMLVGWNPQIAEYPPRPASFESWREDGAGGLERAVRANDPWRRRVGALVPPEIKLDSGRVVNTRVWKWPSKGKASISDHLDRAAACAARHLDAERAALRPRVILTYDKHAAQFFASQARSLGVVLEASPAGDEYVVAWARPSERWGHRCGLVLLKGRQVAYPRETREWIHARIREMVA